jgi:lipopolysaccharide/colanic/teichoic acid biosynthesis glycosyltransferase
MSSDTIDPAACDQSTRNECTAPSTHESAKSYAIKPIMDRFFAVVLLTAFSPIMLAIMVAVKCTSRGPAIFHQRRVGRGGRVFTMHKIRTMVQDAEVRSGPVWAVPSDPRMTRLGRILRKLHLDELPQLWNVIVGEMSLVGPRPERPEFTHRLASDIPRYLDRLAVDPGITGLAQINLPPDTDLDSVRRKLVLDLQYINGMSLGLDLRLLACTACRALGLPGYAVARLIRIRRKVDLRDHPHLSAAVEAPFDLDIVDSRPNRRHAAEKILEPVAMRVRAR